MKTTQVTVKQAKELSAYLTDWNQHTQSIMVDCCIAFSETIHTGMLEDAMKVLGDIEARHEKRGHMSSEDDFIRSAVYYKAAHWTDEDSKRKVRVPANLWKDFQDDNYGFGMDFNLSA